jgi:hypothetical protein
MSDWPVQIQKDELLVRALYCPYHVKNNKLDKAAFKPQKGSNKISVMRHDWLKSDGCKTQAKRLQRDGKKYVGFAALCAIEITTAGATVVDSRQEYEGHADIQIKWTRGGGGEPGPPEEMMEINAVAKMLRDSARYFPDPDPDHQRWMGKEIK